MQPHESTRPDSKNTSTPSLWTALTGIFKRKPDSTADAEAMPQPPPVASLPPAPIVPPTPQFLKLAKGQGTQLRNALDPNAPSESSLQKIGMAEMPTPSSLIPRIVLKPAKTFLQASRSVLSAFRKAPPPRPVVAEPAAPQPPAETHRVGPETRFKDKDYPIV